MPLPGELARRFYINGKNPRFKEREPVEVTDAEDRRRLAIRRAIERREEDKLLESVIDG